MGEARCVSQELDLRPQEPAHPRRPAHARTTAHHPRASPRRGDALLIWTSVDDENKIKAHSF